MKWLVLLLLCVPLLAEEPEMGCTIVAVYEPDKSTKRWHLRVWDKEGATLYSIQDKRKKAMKDCDEWLKEKIKRLGKAEPIKKPRTAQAFKEQ